MLVSQGKVEEAIEMRHGLHQYEEALALGRAHRLPEERLEGMAQEYFRLLLDTKQEERAAALKEKEVCVVCVCVIRSLLFCLVLLCLWSGFVVWPALAVGPTEKR